MNIREYLKKFITYLFLAIWVVVTLFPLYFMFTEGFKKDTDLFDYSKLFWFEPTLKNFETLVREYKILSAIGNSLLITISSVGLCLALSAFGAYALSRFKFRGSKSVAMDILSLRIFPPVVSAIPLLLISKMWGVWGTYHFMILVYAMFNLPLGIWLTKTYFDDVPITIEEAAMVDGCGVLCRMRHMTLPLAMRGISATAILLGIFTWNEFLFANLLTKGETKTVTVVAAMTAGTRTLFGWGEAAACSVVVTLPLIILFILLQKYILRAFTVGAFK